MARVQTTSISGLRELGERMRELSAKVGNKVAGQATGAAAAIVKKAYKQNLRAHPSVDSGLLEKNVISKKLGKRQTTLTAEHIVTVKKSNYPAGKSGKKSNTRQVGSFIEFGTVEIAAEPSLRPAMENNIQTATSAMIAKLEAGIIKAGA